MGAVNLPGLTGATKDGGTWAVRDGQLEIELPATSLAQVMNAASVGDGSRGFHATAIRQRAAG